MKRFLKNAGIAILAIGAGLAIYAVVGLGEIMLRSRFTVSVYAFGVDTIDLIGAAIVLMYATVKTAVDHHNRQKRGIISDLLDEAIMEHHAKLGAIDAEPPAIGKSRRRAICAVTLKALEEMRERTKGE